VIRCLTCGHAHGCQGGCVVAMALVASRNGGRCLDAACAKCDAYQARAKAFDALAAGDELKVRS
jgi:hypothetical protein